jgi:hypothetical protein
MTQKVKNPFKDHRTLVKESIKKKDPSAEDNIKSKTALAEQVRTQSSCCCRQFDCIDAHMYVFNLFSYVNTWRNLETSSRREQSSCEYQLRALAL